MKSFIFLSLWVALISQNVWAEPCLKTRGILDIGSGSTKAKVAVVDSCLQKIVSIVMELQSRKVSYAADLDAQKKIGKSGFSDKVRTDGLRAIRELVAMGAEKAPNIEWSGYATSAFRNSDNGLHSLQEFSAQTQIPFTLISQQIEGELGYASGIQDSDQKNRDDTLVWDIGGGSQQLSYSEQGKIHVIRMEDMASEKFKSLVIHEVKKITDTQVKTPNPIGSENLALSKSLASAWAQSVRLPFVPKEVIGIGGVHSLGIPKVLGIVGSYSVETIDAALPELVKKSDADLNDPFADTMVSNAILVGSFMATLKMNQIKVSSRGTVDGALVYPEFWK